LFMNDLKDLVVKANSSFSSSQKKSNQRFGLSNFVAASTDQMLMTRGGYGASFYSGSGGAPQGWWGQPGDRQAGDADGFGGTYSQNAVVVTNGGNETQSNWQSFLKSTYYIGSKIFSNSPYRFLAQDGNLGNGSRFISRGDSIYDRSKGISYPKY